MTEVLKVIFRKDPRENDYITAVFPTEYESHGLFTVWDPQGGHSSATNAWYQRTVPATPEEYAPYLKQLRAIYESEPDAVQLKVIKRRPSRWT